MATTHPMVRLNRILCHDDNCKSAWIDCLCGARLAYIAHSASQAEAIEQPQSDSLLDEIEV